MLWNCSWSELTKFDLCNAVRGDAKGSFGLAGEEPLTVVFALTSSSIRLVKTIGTGVPMFGALRASILHRSQASLAPR
jgi:hypothetical protein